MQEKIPNPGCPAMIDKPAYRAESELLLLPLPSQEQSAVTDRQ